MIGIFAFANHKEEDKIYHLTLTEIADAQRKDQKLRSILGKMQKCHKMI